LPSPLYSKTLANPSEPHDPTCLCEPPIFPDRFTFRPRASDAFMRPMLAFFHNGSVGHTT
jgi:hypothetical protein